MVQYGVLLYMLMLEYITKVYFNNGIYVILILYILTWTNNYIPNTIDKDKSQALSHTWCERM